MAKVHKSDDIAFNIAQPVYPGLAADSAVSGNPRSRFLEQQTEAVLDEARAKSKSLINQAVAEAAAIRKVAQSEGHRDGLISGRQEMLAAELALKNRFEQVVDDLEGRLAKIIGELEGDLLELGLAIAEKIVNIELDRTDSAFLGVVDEAMTRFQQDDRLVLKCSRNDYWRTLVSSSYADEQTSRVTLFADDSLEPYDLIIESASGSVDAGVSTRLEKIRDGLMDQTGGRT